MKEEASFSETLMPLNVANVLLGLTSFDYRNSQFQRVLNFLYSLGLFIAYSTLIKYATDADSFYLAPKNRDLNALCFYAILYGNALLAVSVVVTGWFRLKAMRSIKEQVISCDESMKKLGLSKNRRLLFRLQLYCLAFLTLVLVGFFLGNYSWILNVEAPIITKLRAILMVYYPIALLGIADASFYFWVRYTRMRLHQLNELLRSMLTTTPQSPQHKRVLAMKFDQISKDFASLRDQIRPIDDNAQTMKAIKQVHLELVKSARSTNEAYGIQILVTMTGSFVLITALLYNAYTIIWYHLGDETILIQIFNVISWVLFYAFKIFIINHSCAKASLEAADTGDIICELYEPSTSREFRAEIRDFTLQLIQNPLIFTACGFFDLDHTFIQGVIGSITTYLVILIQVGDMPKPDDFLESTTVAANESTTLPLSVIVLES